MMNTLNLQTRSTVNLKEEGRGKRGRGGGHTETHHNQWRKISDKEKTLPNI